MGSKKARFQRRSDDRVHLLLPPSGDPVPLDPGKLFVIGRDPRASLVVRSATVSRQHAELDWDDHDPPRPLLCEIRSTNGTYLNNKPVTRDNPQPLRSGDRIRLGEDYVVQYLHVNELRIEPELEAIGKEDTQHIERSSLGHPPPAARPPTPAPAPAAAGAAPVPSNSSSGSVSRGAVNELLAAMDATASDAPLPLEGDLTTTRGGDVLQRLHKQRSSGVLEVRAGGLSGRLLLEEGKCVKAFFASLTGRSAMEHVAQLKTGSYQFRPEDTLQPQNMLTQRLRVPIATNGPVPRHGDLRIVSGDDLLRALEEESLSGVVRIDDDGREGLFVFVDGLVEQASIAGRVGEAALDYLVHLPRGTYRIEQERVGSSAYPLPNTRYEAPGSRRAGRPSPPPPQPPPPRSTLRRAALRPSRPQDSGALRPPSGGYPRPDSDVSSDVAPPPRRPSRGTQRYSSEVAPLPAPHTGRYAPGSDVAPLARPRSRRPSDSDEAPPRNTMRRRPPPLPGRQ